MRLFVAVAVPPRARRALAAAIAPLQARHRDLRWVPAGNWHLTMAFIGRTSIGQRPRARQAVCAAARAVGPCEVVLDGTLGRFGHRVLWADVADEHGGLTVLATAVRESLSAVGIVIDDRPFRAHLTVARARRGQRVPHVRAAVTAPGLPARWTVDRIALMASQPQDGGSVYRDLATWPLGDARVG